MRGPVLQSLVTPEGVLRLFFDDVETGEPEDDEVIVEMRAAPINPSDLGTLLGAGDVRSTVRSGDGYAAVTTATIPERSMRAMAARVGKSLAVGNEGAGQVIAAGRSQAARSLVGRLVALLPAGGSFARYVRIGVGSCIALPEGTDPHDGAAASVNPMTVLAMIETMRAEGHAAIVHTAAASNLGRMMNRLCLSEGIGLVNVVRSEQQAALLRQEGAVHVCVSTSQDFAAELIAALRDTRATICFDAIGGGRLLGQVLASMEAAALSAQGQYTRYGSATHKQGYIYGVLDASATELPRSIGFAWSAGGWLLLPTLDRLGAEVRARMRDRVRAELQTTFRSSFAKRVALPEVLNPDHIRAFSDRATGGKFLLTVSDAD